MPIIRARTEAEVASSLDLIPTISGYSVRVPYPGDWREALWITEEREDFDLELLRPEALSSRVPISGLSPHPVWPRVPGWRTVLGIPVCQCGLEKTLLKSKARRKQWTCRPCKSAYDKSRTRAA